jgi:hypothetical protein
LNFLLGAGNSAGFVGVLAAGSDAAAMTLGAAGTPQVLGAADLGCVGDANGSTCTGASARSLGQGLRLDYWNVTAIAGASACPRSIKGTTAVTNLFATPQRVHPDLHATGRTHRTRHGDRRIVRRRGCRANFDGVGGIGTPAGRRSTPRSSTAWPSPPPTPIPFFVPGRQFPVRLPLPAPR